MADMVTIESKMLKGTVNVPPSKSVAHRAIISAALSDGECRISNIALSEDIKATLRCMRELGAKYTVNEKKGAAVIAPKKTGKKNGTLVLDCGESGSTLRFLMPLSLLSGRPVRLTGHGRLMQRPQKPYFDLFDQKGISYQCEGDSILLSGQLKAGVYPLPGNVSSQFVTGLLFALPLLAGESEIIMTSPLESKGYVDLTLDVLHSFGIEIENRKYERFHIKGGQAYKATDYQVENDYSQAAFFLVAGALGCDVTCQNLRPDSKQGDKEILDIIRRAGGKIEYTADGGIRARRTDVMHGISIDARDIPDLVPILAVLCAFCRGESRIINADRLRMKESDRLAAITSELKQLGADVIEGGNYLRIRGCEVLQGNTTSSWNDHRIAMAIAVAACRVEGAVQIVGAREAVTKSYPDFFEVYDSLLQW